MAVYSALLWQGQFTGSQVQIYTGPSGFVTVIRDVEYWNGTGGSVTFYLIASASGFNPAIVCAVNTVAATAGGHWEGRVVIPSGGGITVPALSAGSFVHIAGYQLA